MLRKKRWTSFVGLVGGSLVQGSGGLLSSSAVILKYVIGLVALYILCTF